jgi:hypothetical protein
MTDDIEIKEGYMYGGWRSPENKYHTSKTSIHDDSTAQKVGMRGGTVQGTIHLSMFTPLMMKMFGNRWFENGCVSIYFTFATTDREEVRAVVKMPPEGEDVENIQLEAKIEMKDGKLAGTGTVSLGKPNELSYLQAQEMKNSPHEDLRILSMFKLGHEFPPENILYSQKEIDRLDICITDHLEYYLGKSPWGGSILSPTASFSAMALGFDKTQTKEFNAVAFYGATEIKYINGPIKADTSYVATGKLAGLGASRKTEYLWLDSVLKEKENGKIVASMRHLNRFMKAGSPLYP